MHLRLVAIALASVLTVSRGGEAKEASPGKAAQSAPVPAPKPVVKTTAPKAVVGPSASTPARDRQLKCGQDWRSLSASEKTTQGPGWPQFYSRCVKRLKAQKN